MATTLTSIRGVEDALASLRVDPDSNTPYQRTSVMTHIAWVPPEWVEAAEDVLAGLAERHPSRTIVLFAQPDDEGGLDASVEVDCFAAGEDRQVCTETIRIWLRGGRAWHPASVVEPLLLPDLPVFLRWRGLPPFGERPFEQLVDTVDRLIVDSTEWPGLPTPYERLILDCLLGDATLFTRSDEVEEQWSLVDAIVSGWQRDRPAFPNYEAGTWGPPHADELIRRDGREWRRH